MLLLSILAVDGEQAPWSHHGTRAGTDVGVGLEERGGVRVDLLVCKVLCLYEPVKTLESKSVL